MQRIWSRKDQNLAVWNADGSPAGNIRQGKLLYLGGQHEKAFQTFEKAAKQLSRKAETVEESELYCRMGIMLATGDGHYRDENLARQYLELGCLEENPESYYLVAKYAQGSQARSALEKAADLGHIGAVRELGNAWYFGKDCSPDVEKAQNCFRQGLTDSSEDGAYCACMLGRIYAQKKEAFAPITGKLQRLVKHDLLYKFLLK